MEQTDGKVREPQQKRSIELKQKLLDTAIKLFSEKGYHRTGSNEIARAAGVSVGSFYSYFRDKKQILIDVLDYLDQRMDDSIRPPDTGPGPDKKEFIRTLLNKILLAHKNHPRFHKELVAMQILDPEISEITKIRDQRTIDSYYRGLKQWADQMTVGNLEAASFIIYKAVDSVIHEIVGLNTGIDEGVLLRELTDLIYRYLFAASG
jgi:AcrR family transcriptional regulator